MQGNIPALLITDAAKMPGTKPNTSAADTIPAAAAASKYTVPDEETFILRATSGLYRGEITKLFDDLKDLATNPIGNVPDPGAMLSPACLPWDCDPADGCTWLPP